MVRTWLRRYAIGVAAWLPFFVIWVLYALSYAHYTWSAAVVTSLISMGSVSVLGVLVWHLCRRVPLPLRLDLRFYFLQLLFAAVYSLSWSVLVHALESLRNGTNPLQGLWSSPFLPWQLLTGVWLYGLFAGVSYAVQTRVRLHEEETLAVRAAALATAARLDALRARLNPHFMFNALHTLAALVKFRPAAAENAIERLGDMLRYTLREDGRQLVAFAEEHDFTRQYLGFEQLRYEDRLTVHWQIDERSFDFEILPFSLQTLVENAVHHAIAIRPRGGSIWITTACDDDALRLSVRDDGPGGGSDAGSSHQIGLRSLRERLHAVYGPSATLQIASSTAGFEAGFRVPAAGEHAPAARPPLAKAR